MTTPEARARHDIDDSLIATGWVIQNRAEMNLGVSRGVAVREFPLKTGYADYLLFVARKAIGAVEAKAAGATLTGVEAQSEKYSAGLPDIPPAWRKPLPFLYESTGIETFFTDGRDPAPRSRRVFAFHRPETLAQWMVETEDSRGLLRALRLPPLRSPPSPHTLRARLQRMPPLITKGLWPAQIEAITNLERSFAEDRPRALIQMATGSGKTFTAVNAIYRLIKFADARRVLFLVDRANLGRQTLREFQAFVTPDDGRKFTELYNVQRLGSNTFDPVSRVCITTIQRLYSMLNNEPDLPPDQDEMSLFELGAAFKDPKVVRYNPRIPIEYFDFIVTDECHRSIYNLWRQVLEYFDAFLIGLTATPSKQTFGFFNQNLVQEYTRQRAVADGVNVDGLVYRIRTEITERGSTINAGYYVGKRDKLTRQQRWEMLDEDLTYAPEQLDRDVVAESQIRTVIQAYRDKLFTDLFPGRTQVPKTIVFAKDDAHADQIVRIIREEFGKGNDFCKKITYKVTGVDPETLIAQFRNSYDPRIAVSVDMISTGTDIKPVEVLLFMRAVQSRLLYEQMLGRGTRIINATDLQAVTSDAPAKTHFVIVDAVGITESPKLETQSLERNPSAPFEKLLEAVALGARDDDTLSSLAGRLARLECNMTEQDAYAVAAVTNGKSMHDLINSLLNAIDPDLVGDDPEANAQMVEAAAAPFDNPDLRKRLVNIQKRSEQIIDVTSINRVTQATFADSTAAKQVVTSFHAFIELHKDDITALQLIYSRPYRERALTFQQVKDLAEQLKLTNSAWTTESLWMAYAQVEQDKVRGTGGQRVLADLVSLVRHAVQMDDELVPYPDRVTRRYAVWVADQEADGRTFTPDQRWWLDQIARHIGVNLAMTPADLSSPPFFDKGGVFGMMRVFKGDVNQVISEMNQALAV